MRRRTFAVMLVFLTFLMFCSPVLGQGSGSTDKEFYSLGETVRITAEGLPGGLWPSGELAICNVIERGWIGVRSFMVAAEVNITWYWGQSGNTNDPLNGPFYQVEPGFYEIIWFPAGMHGFFVLCRFLICAQSPDLNADGIVNIFDITVAVSAYGSKVGEPRWISGADMAPKEGIIDLFDLVTIVSYYGQLFP